MTTEQQIQERTEQKRARARKLNQFTYRFSRHWLLLANTFMGVLITLPWLAPVFMEWGWETPARIIHTIYQTLCHQFPQRSYFLFGEQTMYTLEEISRVWPNVSNPLVIRQFIGTPEMGWKVAWSDRMVSMYGGIFLFGVLFALVRDRLKPLPFWGLFLFSLPMALDGGSHTISDLYGLGNGFRYTNEWLAELTNHAFSQSFYVGNALGSFNSWMRLITGLLFGLGVVWFAFPYLEASFRQTIHSIENKFNRAGLDLET